MSSLRIAGPWEARPARITPVAVAAFVLLAACRDRTKAPVAVRGPVAAPVRPAVVPPPPPAPPPVVSRALTLVPRDTTLAVLHLDDDTITVMAQVDVPVPAHAGATVAGFPHGHEWPSGVASLRLIGTHHRTIYTTMFPTQQDSVGRLVAAVTVTATPMLLDSEPAVFLVASEEPHVSGRGETWQVVIPRARGAATGTGRVANRVTRPIRAAVDARLDALPGNEVVVEVTDGIIGVDVPIVIAPDSPNAIGGIIPRPAHDAAYDIARMPVTRLSGPAFPPGSGAHDVALYRGPRGEGVDTVRVAPTSTVEYGDAYGDITVARDPDPAFIEEVRIGIAHLRLAITVDGHPGFVETHDFSAVGLQPLN